MSTAKQISSVCDDEEIRLVRLLHVDNGGVVRGRTVSGEDVESALDHGVTWPAKMQLFTSLEQIAPGDHFSVADEIVLLPDPETFTVVPYADKTAIMLCDAHTLKGEPEPIDPRSTLRELLHDLRDQGLSLAASFESEFYLTRESDAGLKPYDNELDLSADGMQSAHDIVLDIVEALEQQGLEFSSYYPELGPGQQEIVTKYDTGISAADNHVLYKQTVKAVAKQHDLNATFVPVPFKDGPGSGCHVNLSLWDGDENVFHGSNSPYGLSQQARYFVGGILHHAPAILALSAPNVISYRRLHERQFASAYTCWGEGNREAIVRVPASFWTDHERSTRIEFKPADNTANPYLILIGLLAAGMDGIDNERDPGDPINIDPADMSKEELRAHNVRHVPKSLGQALDALEANAVIRDSMGEALHDCYLALKRHQWEQFAGQGQPTQWEIDRFTRPF